MMNVYELLRAYQTMLLIRVVEERIAERYDEDKMKCPTHLSIGQEAVAVGVMMHMTDEDVIFSTHRCHAHYLAKGGDVKRMMAEMYGKETGCARGRGGSMHLIDVERGMYGSSAIVGGSMPLPLGAALAFQLRGEKRFGAAFFGDAGIEPGVFHECMNFAALRKLPILFVCEDNDYSTMTRRHERQCVPIAERAVGYGIPGVRVDGNDVQAVYVAAKIAAERARASMGPSFIEATTYRWREHVEHNKGIMSRPAEELQYWKARCPLERCRRELESGGIHAEIMDKMLLDVGIKVDEAFRFAEESPFPLPANILSDVGDGVAEIPETPPTIEERTLTTAEAVAEATVQAMEADPSIFVFGLHVTDPNGVFGTTKLAFERFGTSRVFETPISEAALTGVAGGAAMLGMRPLHVHARNDFLLLCLDQLGNQLSKWHYMSGGQLKVPVVIRAIVGRSRGQGCQHSQSLQSLFAHFPGLHVVAPSNAYDAKGMLFTALTGDCPVIFLEHRMCHTLRNAVPIDPYRLPFGKARVTRTGKDLTIVTILQMVYEAERAAETLAEMGVSAEVIDLRSIRPWDTKTVCASVRKTGRVIVADTGWTEFGISAEIASRVTESEFHHLKAAPVRIGLPECPTPTAEPLETAYYPNSRDIVAWALNLLNREVPDDLAGGFATEALKTPF